MRCATRVPRDADESLGSSVAAGTVNNVEGTEAPGGRPEEEAPSELCGPVVSPRALRRLNWPPSEARAEATRGNKK